MKINDAIKNILKETLPDSINNIHIRYDLRESKSLTYCDQKDYIITIMPVEIDCENVAASTRVLSRIFPFDFNESSLAYKYLQRQIEEMLMIYIKNVKKYGEKQGDE